MYATLAAAADPEEEPEVEPEVEPEEDPGDDGPDDVVEGVAMFMCGEAHAASISPEVREREAAPRRRLIA